MGLRQALNALRISIHNTIGIGDAENDHDLLDACEVGVAVAWGSPALRAVADEIVDGTGPPAVADYISRIAVQPRLSAAQMGRRVVIPGHQLNGDPLALAIRGRTIVIAGEPGSGKSWLAGLLCEQFILQGYCLCIIDPEGDYRSLEMLPGVITLGGDDPPPSSRELIRALRHPDVSVVVDLSKMPHEQKTDYLRTLLRTLMALRRSTGLPHKIVLDEAHYYLAGPHGGRLVDAELAGYVLVTYRVSGLDSTIRDGGDNVVMVTRESDSHEIHALLKMCHPNLSAPDESLFSGLAMNEAALLPGPAEAGGVIRRFRVGPRLTCHVRHQSKYLDMPVLERQAFVFTDDGQAGPRARTLKEFIGLLSTVTANRVRGHLERHDFSRWLGDVFRDRGLASHVHRIESRFTDGNLTDITSEIAQAIRARYELPVDRGTPDAA